MRYNSYSASLKQIEIIKMSASVKQHFLSRTQNMTPSSKPPKRPMTATQQQAVEALKKKQAELLRKANSSISKYDSRNLAKTPEDKEIYKMVEQLVKQKYAPYGSIQKRKPIDNVLSKIPYFQGQVLTSYEQDHPGKKAPKIAMESPTRRDFFNLEKKHKVINPHKMQCLTQTMTDFKGWKNPISTSKRLINPPTSLKTGGPLLYRDSDYPDWGIQPVFREKNPQYPQYQLPFRGKSVLSQTYKDPKTLSKNTLIKHDSKIKLHMYESPERVFQTTSREQFKPFSLNQSYIRRKKKEDKDCQPKTNIIGHEEAKGVSQHYKTIQGMSFKGCYNYKPSPLDFIPYP